MTQCSSRKESASTHSSRSTAPKTNASTPCINGDGPMGFCARTVATTDLPPTAASSNSAILPPDITAGTIFDSTKLPLTVWFQAIYLMTQDKKGVSAMKLHRHLGISYNAAWRIRHKLMQVMMERDREHPLSGWIQLDDAYLGGERSGGKRGRGAPGKTPFVAAVQTNEQGHPLRMKLTVVEGFRLTEIAAWAQLHLGKGTRVVSDGLACFHGVTAAGCVHEPVVVGSGKAAVERPEFRWVNTILGNIKNALRGTYHAICRAHPPFAPGKGSTRHIQSPGRAIIRSPLRSQRGTVETLRSGGIRAMGVSGRIAALACGRNL